MSKSEKAHQRDRPATPAVTPPRRRAEMPVVSIEQAIEDVKQGKFLVVVDDEDRENEGDLFIAADFVSADAINFMATHGRGLICTPLEGSRLDDLGIEP